MITALDTMVVLDVLLNDPTHGATSARALRRCTQGGAIVVSPIVWAELAAGTNDDARAPDLLDRLGARFSPLGIQAASLAGTIWRLYRERGGQRRRAVADFLIGAHALHHADRLLTRDRGFYRDYFVDLDVVEPG